MIHPEIIVQENERPFSWSLRRSQRFHRCRREYFYHYYGSGGGHEPGCGEIHIELLHLLRGLMERSAYVSRLMIMSLRELFYFTEDDAPEIFSALVISRFEKEFEDMISGACERDHRKPMLREISLPEVSLRNLRRELRLEVKIESASWSAGVVKKLLEIPLPERRYIPFPAPVQIGEITAYTPAVAAWNNNGKLHILESGPGSAEQMMLHKFLALKDFSRAPDQSVSRFISSGAISGEMELDSISDPLRKLRDDVAEMTALRRDDGSWHENDFAVSSGYCNDCRFREFCRKMEKSCCDT